MTLQGEKEMGFIESKGELRGGSEGRYKNSMCSKINRSLPDFKGPTTKLQNKRRC